MTMPLEGIRVLDWTQWQQGPVAAAMLADLGADVIKIEDPVTGDPARGVESMAGSVTFVTGRNSYYEGNNRNKRSITINLKNPQGLELLYKLVEKSDVFLHNFREAIANRLGLGYETLRERNPRLIYAIASGVGTLGPEADAPAFDLTGLARSGIMTLTGEPGMAPMYISGGIGDQMGATMMAYGVLTAIIARERFGVGQRVEASLLGAMLWLQANNLNYKLVGGQELGRRYRSAPPQPLWNHYLCADDKWIVLVHLQAQRYWPNVCRAMDLVKLEHDPRFDTMEQRRTNSAELTATLDMVFATKTREEWAAIFKENDVIYTNLNDFDDVIRDPQITANGYITEFDHPAWGPIRVPGVPVRLSETPGQLRREAPEHGQHTEEILMEMLGYDWDQIAALRDEKAI